MTANRSATLIAMAPNPAMSIDQIHTPSSGYGGMHRCPCSGMVSRCVRTASGQYPGGCLRTAAVTHSLAFETNH